MVVTITTHHHKCFARAKHHGNITRYYEVDMPKKTWKVEFDGGFCFVEAKNDKDAESRAIEEFGMRRGPYRASPSRSEDLDKFKEGNGEVLKE